MLLASQMEKNTMELFAIIIVVTAVCGEKTASPEVFENMTLDHLQDARNVTMGPNVGLGGQFIYHRPGEKFKIQCNVSTLSPVNVTWTYSCLYPSDDCSKLEDLAQQTNHSEIEITANAADGILKCRACNLMGCEEQSVVIAIANFSKDPLKEGNPMIIGSSKIVFEGDTIHMTCYVTNRFCNFTWYNQYIQRRITPKKRVRPSRTDIDIYDSAYASRLVIKIANWFHSQRRLYTCSGFCTNGELEPRNISKSFLFQTRAASPLTLRYPESEDAIMVTEGSMIHLNCGMISDPLPLIEWRKNNELIRVVNLTDLSNRFSFTPDHMRLSIKEVVMADQGKFVCNGTSRNKTLLRTFHLSVNHKITWSLFIFVPILIILTILLVLAFIRLICHAKIMKKQQTGTNLGMEMQAFLEGEDGQIRSRLTLQNQAEVLPYDPKYEYPRENLKLGRVLGSGEFGMVVRATANAPFVGSNLENISEGSIQSNPITVAVKMVKPNPDLSQIKALITELRIMIHAGHHVNVLGLLGACTTNLNKEEFFIITEYCKYGNLRFHLRSRRDTFVDQKNHLRDTFDFSIAVQRQYENQLSSSSGEDPNTEMKVHTRDLVSWSYQVAKGLQYLASKKIVHADLAARNVLLAEDNEVKICDFGLSRNLNNQPNYLKKGDEPMPIKWMAIESIQDRIFSTETDIWSFGVVLWELFTLAKTPLPGIPLDDRFLVRLIEGYRMDKPYYATSALYDLMRKCWDMDATQRPKIEELVFSLAQILGVSEQHDNEHQMRSDAAAMKEDDLGNCECLIESDSKNDANSESGRIMMEMELF